MRWLDEASERLVRACCVELSRRAENDGDWATGQGRPPACFAQLRDRELPGLRDEALWLLPVEQFVYRQAARLVAEQERGRAAQA